VAVDRPSAPAGDADGSVAARPFRLLWAGQTVSVVGDGLAVLAVPLIVLQLTGQPVAAALASTPRTVGYLLAGLVAGPVVDRVDARRAMVVSDAVRTALFGVMAALAFAGELHVWEVLAFAFAGAAAGVFFETAYAIVVQDLLRPDALVAGNARLEMSNQLGLLIGPAIVGVLAATVGLPAALAVNAASYLVSIATLVALRTKVPAVASAAPLRADLRGIARDLVQGLRYIAGHRLIRALAGLQFSINFLLAAETLVVFFAKNVLHAPPLEVGVVVATGAAGGIVGTALTGPLVRRWRSQALVALGIAVLSVALAAFAVVRDVWSLAIANGVLGGGTIVGTVNIRALRQQIVPRAMLGRVTATARTLAVAANPAGAAIAGVLTAVAGGDPRPTFLAAGALGVCCAALGYRFGLRASSGPVTLAEHTT
jgi:MFS family permease